MCEQKTIPPVVRWLAYTGGITAGTLATTQQLSPSTLALVIMGELASLPILLITMLTLVAVCSRHPARRKTAERILCRLLGD
ncbi:MAG: hypothetical protein JO272_11775 [Pseudonocardiales bacterium]|nr:hypothetical protein [Pseudonocardiales bacterium]